MSFSDGLRRFGFALPADGRPKLVLAGSIQEIDRNYPHVDAALRTRRGYGLVLAAHPSDLTEMRRRYPHEAVVPLPHQAVLGFWCQRVNAALLVGPAWMERKAVPFVDGSTDFDADYLTWRLPPVDWRRPAGVGPVLADLLGAHRLRSLSELKARLGSASTIVCLGNGPSSEDGRLAAFGGAALFRVNWTWRGRGRMTQPDAVFTADADLPGPGRTPILVFPTAAVGAPVLRRHARRLRPPKRGYVFLDRLDPALADLSQPVIPTNGALMIAVAAALQPKRIVIAGMDLYRHPEGRYPGDNVAVDGYGRDHSAEVDLALIGNALAAFGGEVINLSDNLATAIASSG